MDNRTLLPIRALIETMSGTIEWDENDQKVSINLLADTLQFWIGKNTAVINGIDKNFDVPPQVINNRTIKL